MKRILLLLFCALLSLPAVVFAEEPEMDTGYISGDIFEEKSGWFHSYISLSEVYNDNIYNTDKEEEGDLITVVNPGIQLTIPGTDQRAEDIATDPATPGGLIFGRFAESSFRRFKAYAGYAPIMQFYADNKDEDVVNHYAQAGLQLNFRGGLFIDAIDRFDRNYDHYKAGVSTQIDSYNSNVFHLMVGIPLSEKFRVRADYANFQVNYTDEEENGSLDRTDNTGSGYIFFQFRPKTSVYLNYEHTNLDYENDPDRNGKEQDILAGLRWDFSAKTDLNIQAGYGTRSYDDSAVDDSESFVYRLNIGYRLTPKTRLALTGYRRNEESSLSAYDYTRTTVLSCTFYQALNPKINIELGAFYRHYDYVYNGNESADEADRVDRHFVLTPTLVYNFRSWLSASAAYSFRRRNSDDDASTYTGNMAIFKITGSI